MHQVQLHLHLVVVVVAAVVGRYLLLLLAIMVDLSIVVVGARGQGGDITLPAAFFLCFKRYFLFPLFTNRIRGVGRGSGKLHHSPKNTGWKSQQQEQPERRPIKITTKSRA